MGLIIGLAAADEVRESRKVGGVIVGGSGDFCLESGGEQVVLVAFGLESAVRRAWEQEVGRALRLQSSWVEQE